MPRISVVVPIYNVEPYLAACLESIERQTVDDLEVLMVDDGSTDGSAAIAERVAARDGRFRLITQPNGGLSRARNTGTDQAVGEFLSFVDSDDLLPPNAYELHLEALDRTGSQFSTGNVQRLTTTGVRQARFLARTFRETRLQTHITRFRPLLNDRTAWNKLWRKDFWDAHGFRFPDGRINEDIPVVLPAHFSATSVDVLHEPVYFWRQRDTGDLSITERRLERKALLDRVAACEDVLDFLAANGPAKAKRWYDESVVRSDLTYYLNQLDLADDDYRELFLDRVNQTLEKVDDAVFETLLPIERLKWHLLRRRMLPELLEVLRFQREDLDERLPVRENGKWYGDFPYRGDPERAIPDEIFRYENGFTASVRIDDLGRDGDRLRIGGAMFLRGIGAPTKRSQSVTVTFVRSGRFERLLRTLGLTRLRTRRVHRPDLNGRSSSLVDVSWAGFRSTLDPRRLRTAGRWRPGTWEVYLTVRSQGVRRRRGRFRFEGVRPPAAVDLPAPDHVLVRAVPTRDDALRLEVHTHWARVTASHADGDGLVLSGELHPPASGGGSPTLELRGGEHARTFSVPAELEGGGGRFTARVGLAEVAAAARPAQAIAPGVDHRAGVTPSDPSWQLALTGAGRRRRLALPEAAAGAVRDGAAREAAVVRARQGDATLVLRRPRPLLTDARWTGDGVLEVEGELPELEAEHELVLVADDFLEEHAFAMGAAGGRFSGRLTVAAVPGLAGAVPLRAGTWELCLRPVGTTAEVAARVPVLLGGRLAERLPVAADAAGKPFHVAAAQEGTALVVAGSDLLRHERGRFAQRRLREGDRRRRTEPLRDAVVYASFRGRQCSDSPRAIFEELRRRDAPLEHLWVVRDGQFRAPEGAIAVRASSEEHHAALARCRYVVANDELPSWFEVRAGQVCLQTWHGTPLKRLGLDVSSARGRWRAKNRWARQTGTWTQLLSPSAFATPILRSGFDFAGEVLETGLPRTDVLLAPDAAERGRRLRERLGIRDGVRTVLYAPTFRDHLGDEARGFQMGLQLDLERLRRALAPETVVLVRRHPYVGDTVPETPDGRVRDVSALPDATELLLAADVLVTDYSSIAVDFANTGRPMVFFTPDLDAYGEHLRGFTVDLAGTVPGPLLRTTDDLAEALRDVDALAAAHADRYAAFRARFCALDDGNASARVVDRVFGG